MHLFEGENSVVPKGVQAGSVESDEKESLSDSNFRITRTYIAHESFRCRCVSGSAQSAMMRKYCVAFFLLMVTSVYAGRIAAGDDCGFMLTLHNGSASPLNVSPDEFSCIPVHGSSETGLNSDHFSASECSCCGAEKNSSGTDSVQNQGMLCSEADGSSGGAPSDDPVTVDLLDDAEEFCCIERVPEKLQAFGVTLTIGSNLQITSIDPAAVTEFPHNGFSGFRSVLRI